MFSIPVSLCAWLLCALSVLLLGGYQGLGGAAAGLLLLLILSVLLLAPVEQAKDTRVTQGRKGNENSTRNASI